jgi:selenocysteine-specific elongation factor
MSSVQHFIVATAGHVDHGKSALVKALTGTDPDRLPEEKLRGITIDLGFAHLELKSPADPPTSFLLGIVDVPGHEDFVKNMVAGVGSIDLALLIVAADDGWMPQTEEHLQILTYLGVTRAVIALTKIDLAQDEAGMIASVREKLLDTPFSDSPIVPTSILNGRGLEELKSALARELARTPPPRDIGKPRLPVDRVFNLQGIGTVVTGTLTGGALRRGQSVVIQPSGKAARIRNIQSHNRNVESSGPGTRTALNLPNVIAQEDIRRGDVVTLAEFGGPSTILDVALEVLPRAVHQLKQNARIRIHHGSGDVPARVAFFTAKKLSPGERALAQLRLEAPAFVFAGDRFVVRDWAEQNTLAGGIVLDENASSKLHHSEARANCLNLRAGATEDIWAYILSQLQRDGAARKSQMLRKSRFSDEEISAAISRLAAGGDVTIVGEFVADTAKWTNVRQRAIDSIDARHRTHSEDAGMSLTDLRAGFEADLPFADLFDELVKDLCSSEFVQTGAVIGRASHRPALSTVFQAAVSILRAALNEKPFDPPSRDHLAPDPVSQQALRFLIKSGDAIEINEEVIMAAEHVRRATQMIRDFIRARGPATVSDLRQMLGSTRRVTLPLLLRLDRDGVTSRQGDKRILRQ